MFVEYKQVQNVSVDYGNIHNLLSGRLQTLPQ